MDPLTHGGGPGSKLQIFPIAPHCRALQPALCNFLVVLVAREGFSKLDFFQNPSITPGMGLGDHLVTIQVFEHLYGPT